jgi:hypothetical protein
MISSQSAIAVIQNILLTNTIPSIIIGLSNKSMIMEIIMAGIVTIERIDKATSKTIVITARIKDSKDI